LSEEDELEIPALIALAVVGAFAYYLYRSDTRGK
jgi:hypothetical protein